MTEESVNTMNEPVAIVGMAVRLPQARTLDAFWHNLLAGAEAVREFTPADLDEAGVPERIRDHPNHVPRGVVLEDVDHFDASFFGLTPQEARVTDPQHRVFLETAWHALEDAGVAPHQAPGTVGVFASCSLSTYLLNNILKSEHAGDGPELSYPVLIGNDKDFLATRISYRLGLTGPSQTVQSACSSSLVALHQALAALRDGDCDMALAGGVSITVPQTGGHLHKTGGIASADGHCRPFDQAAGGTLRGNGAGVVVLKRLSDALADRDHVYAVVRGSAVNNDGLDKIGFTAPSVRGQSRAISAALASSGVDPETIGYVEAHGTGTALGDPIEVKALSQAHNARSACALGSVKANLGHLDAAAGVVGVIKTALILHHQVIPPQINYSAPNHRIPLERSRFVVHTRAQVPDEPLSHAAVSSFGLGGTNGHCVLARHTPAAARPAPSSAAPYVLLLSAKTPQALERQARQLRSYLDRATPRLDDLAFTLGEGRTHFDERLAFAVRTPDEARAALDDYLERGIPAGDHPVAAAFVDGQHIPPERLGDLDAAVKLSVPSYPFEPESHWIAPVPPAPAASQDTAAAPTGDPGALSADVQAEIIAILKKLLGADTIGAEDDFFDLGGDSLTAVDAVNLLRDAYQVDIDLDEFADLRTPRAMSEHVASLLSGTASAWSGTVRVREGQGSHLFLLYPAGGTNFCYFRLAEHLSHDGPLTAFSYPRELGDGEVTIRELAALYVRQMRAVQPHGPYRLAGYSFGGNLAFEVALQLQRAGEKTDGLYLFDAHPPEAYVGESLTEQEFLAAFPHLMASVMPGTEPQPDLPAPRTVQEAVQLLKNRPDWMAANEQDFLRFITIWRRNHEALKGYYPDGKVRGRVVVFDAMEAHPEKEVGMLRIKLLGKEHWRKHVDGDLHTVPVPGNHYTMFTQEDLVPRLAAAFQAELDTTGT
ncbi:beta-ketoacyl synthase N-terminal-like domain-containing protein [Streptomyces sp. 1222.5]|uniref:beta-ketoacyl synthase N-terminal-like domain-containing protein n=1 Tax=Streptomyces sp. 1222.5 TaxID=1881026 RepID=UPI003EBD48F3